MLITPSSKHIPIRGNLQTVYLTNMYLKIQGLEGCSKKISPNTPVHKERTWVYIFQFQFSGENGKGNEGKEKQKTKKKHKEFVSSASLGSHRKREGKKGEEGRKRGKWGGKTFLLLS